MKESGRGKMAGVDVDGRTPKRPTGRNGVSSIGGSGSSSGVTADSCTGI
jgi:hypothetical protein